MIWGPIYHGHLLAAQRSLRTPDDREVQWLDCSSHGQSPSRPIDMARTDSVRYGARVHQSAGDGMSRDGKSVKIAVVGLNPGFMDSESVLMHTTTAARKKQHRFDVSESPEYIGRAVVL